MGKEMPRTHKTGSRYSSTHSRERFAASKRRDPSGEQGGLLLPVHPAHHTQVTVPKVSHWFDPCDSKRFDRSPVPRKGNTVSSRR